LGHPCSIHAGPRMNELQLVAEIRPLAEASGQRSWDPRSASHYYLFPLPALLAGEDYVVDFRRVGMTHYKNLDDKRIACMNLTGWAALQRRWAYHSLRVDLPLSIRMDDVRGYWNEINLWEEWNSRGLAADTFQPWLDS